MWRITEVDDDRPSRKGPQRLLGMRLDSDLGQPLSFKPRGTIGVQILQEIQLHNFDRCPICLDRPADSPDHVPQQTIGGEIRTRTCTKCNNTSGSYLEAPLTELVYGRLQSAQIEGPGVGNRRRVNLDVLWTPHGIPGFLLRHDNPEMHKIISTGAARITPRADRDRARLGMLKHAYLAASCNLGRIPEGDHADSIRAEIVAAVNAASTSSVPVGPIARSIGFRVVDKAQWPAMALAAVPSDRRADRADVWIALAGTLLVQWPLNEHNPRLDDQVAERLGGQPTKVPADG